MESLENAIKEARKARRLTQGKVADKLKVARTTVSNWECGRSQPDLLTLREQLFRFYNKIFGYTLPLLLYKRI